MSLLSHSWWQLEDEVVSSARLPTVLPVSTLGCTSRPDRAAARACQGGPGSQQPALSRGCSPSCPLQGRGPAVSGELRGCLDGTRPARSALLARPPARTRPGGAAARLTRRFLRCPAGGEGNRSGFRAPGPRESRSGPATSLSRAPHSLTHGPFLTFRARSVRLHGRPVTCRLRTRPAAGPASSPGALLIKPPGCAREASVRPPPGAQVSREAYAGPLRARRRPLAMFGPAKGGHLGVRPAAGGPGGVSPPAAATKAGPAGVWPGGGQSGTMWRLRCKAKDGTHVLQGLSSRTRLRELQSQIAAITGIAPGAQRILVGFPPECLDLGDGDLVLEDLPIQSGDMLIVEEDQTRPNTSPAFTKHGAPGSVREALPVLTRTMVPADNSCLFTSVYYVVEGGVLDPACAPQMRRLIAQIVASDPDLYSEAILGKTNQEYCEWIRRDDTWGGAIEISILSKFYQCEICVVDTQTVRIDRFGEDAGYTKRVLLIYDGVHYDPLQRNFPDPDTPPLTIFSSNDDIVLVQALELADEARRKRQFTDINRFTLRCMVCQKGLTGQAEAREHAKETGHTNFGEV